MLAVILTVYTHTHTHTFIQYTCTFGYYHVILELFSIHYSLRLYNLCEGDPSLGDLT